MKAQRFALDHQYIEANSIAERYLRRELSMEQRAAFEQHFVDCEECRDRLALAEMFLASEPAPPEPEPHPITSPAPVPVSVSRHDGPHLPPVAVWLGQLQLWQLLTGIGAAAMLVLSIPSLLFLRDQRHSAPVYRLQPAGETAISSGAAAVLLIHIPGSGPFGEYRAALRCEDGGTRWLLRDLRPASGGVLALAIQPDTLRAGRCVLDLSGVAAGGGETRVATFQLRVKPR
ncbi:MAG: zf-HC2 domain-containing protein [Bryobacteraceae bacterium]|nr:zf-HC2 domain-containing protein [Bryobacteraceae bacterium]